MPLSLIKGERPMVLLLCVKYRNAIIKKTLLWSQKISYNIMSIYIYLVTCYSFEHLFYPVRYLF